jgi:hypothetical protein
MIEALITNFPAHSVQDAGVETEQMAFFERPPSEFLASRPSAARCLWLQASARKRLSSRSRERMLVAQVVLWATRIMESNAMLKEVWGVKGRWTDAADADIRRLCQKQRIAYLFQSSNLNPSRHD